MKHTEPVTAREAEPEKTSSTQPAPKAPATAAGHDRANEPVEMDMDLDMVL